MSKELSYNITTKSPDKTMGIAEQLANNCQGGEVFLLTSDLGGGKTTFTKGLAKGLGSKDIVSSPTFTISQIYDCRDNIRLYHFDFYRLSEGGMVSYELAEVLDDPRAVIVIEWGDVIEEVLPKLKVTVNIGRLKEGEQMRALNINIPKDLNYLAVGLEGNN